MTEAQVEPIEPDPFLAAGFLERAEQFAHDGTSDAVGVESRLVLLHNAVICACDAVLAIHGRRVVGSEGGHRLRIAEAEMLLPGGDSDLFDDLDDARVARNEVSYSTSAAPAGEIDDIADAVARLVGLCRALIVPQLPDWLTGGDSDGR